MRGTHNKMRDKRRGSGTTWEERPNYVQQMQVLAFYQELFLAGESAERISENSGIVRRLAKVWVRVNRWI